MNKYEISTYGRYGSIRCVKEGNKVLNIQYAVYCPKEECEQEPITYKDIVMWEPPYEDEEITIEEKKEILEAINKKFNIDTPYDNIEVRIDFSLEKNIVHYNEILNIFKSNYNLMKDIYTEQIKIFDKMHVEFKYNLYNNIPCFFYKYCDLPKEEFIKFKEEISKRKEIQYLLTEFAKWKVNEDKENINQKKFNYGLYALEILLCESTKEQVKEILKKYIELSKEKNLTFEPFMKRDRELNKLIEEIKCKNSYQQ